MLDAVLMVAILLGAGFWIGVLLDYGPVRFGGTEMPTAARAIGLAAVVGALGWIVATRLIARLGRRLPDDSVAKVIERCHPKVGGRLTTFVELVKADRPDATHHPEMLRRLGEQAAGTLGDVDPSRVVRSDTTRRRLGIAVPMWGLIGGLALAAPAFAGRAVRRLTLLSDEPWPRRAELRMVGVDIPTPRLPPSGGSSAPPTNGSSGDDSFERRQFVDRAVTVPRGADVVLRIAAAATDAEIPQTCRVMYTGDDGTRGRANMKRIGRVRDGWQSFVLDGPPLTSIDQTYRVDVRGLDARLDDFRIESVEPPRVVDSQIDIWYPNYLADPALAADGSRPPDVTTPYQAGMWIREGGRIRLAARFDRPVDRVTLHQIGDDSGEASSTAGSKRSAVKSTPGTDRAEVRIDDVTTAVQFLIVPRDDDGISPLQPPRYLFTVSRDQPPVVRATLSGIGSAITPDARLPFRVVAEDDYGIVSAAMRLDVLGSEPADDTTTEGDGVSGKTSSTANLRRDLTLDREGVAEDELDLRTLAQDGNLSRVDIGQTIRLVATVRDAYDLRGRHDVDAEAFLLPVVTPEDLVAGLERRELEMRGRLEQILTECESLKGRLLSLAERLADSADGDRPNDVAETGSVGAESDEASRLRQVARLQVQSAALQASKTGDELAGVETVVRGIVEQLRNNRIDAPDRIERLTGGVADPLASVLADPLPTLRRRINDIERSLGSEPAGSADPAAGRKGDDGVADPPATALKSVEACDRVIGDLREILERVVDLESFNEVLDLLRGVIDDQQDLIERSREESKRRVLDLFQ